MARNKIRRVVFYSSDTSKSWCVWYGKIGKGNLGLGCLTSKQVEMRLSLFPTTPYSLSSPLNHLLLQQEQLSLLFTLLCQETFQFHPIRIMLLGWEPCTSYLRLLGESLLSSVRCHYLPKSLSTTPTTGPLSPQSHHIFQVCLPPRYLIKLRTRNFSLRERPRLWEQSI